MFLTSHLFGISFERDKKERFKTQQKEGPSEGQGRRLTIQQRMQQAMRNFIVNSQQKQYEKLKSMNFDLFASLRFNVIRYMPKCICRCCVQVTSRDTIFQRAFTKFREEVNLVNMLKELRVVKAAVQSKMTEKQWKQVKKSYSTKTLWLRTSDKLSKRKTITMQDFDILQLEQNTNQSKEKKPAQERGSQRESSESDHSAGDESRPHNTDQSNAQELP